MTFKSYGKVHRLGKSETKGILEGTCYIQEKIDGANASIWSKEGKVHCGSRNRQLEGGFNGFCEYVENHSGIQRLLKDHPDFRLHGEWLTRHTIVYREDAYKKFYLFDISLDDEDKNGMVFLDLEATYKLAEEYGLETPQLFAKLENPEVSYIKECAGKSCLGDHGEGVVVKNYSFVNSFGVRQHAKYVAPSFKETRTNKLTKIPRDTTEGIWEEYVSQKYISEPRVRKLMHKISELESNALSLSDIPRVCNAVYHDILTEDMWEISQKVEQLNFRLLKTNVYRATVTVYKKLLEDDLEKNA